MGFLTDPNCRLSTGEIICPECGTARSPLFILDHMVSEHSEDDELCGCTRCRQSTGL